jgi:hypothetical protein
MKVHFLFSRNKKIGSKLISWAASFENLQLEHLPSHVAVLLDETWVLESTMSSGIRVLPYESWLEINKQLYKFKSKVVESEVVLKTAAKLWGLKYDWAGVIYFGIKYLQLIVCGRQLPSRNAWQMPRAYFCTELAAMLEGKDYSMVSPARLCASLMHKEESINESKKRA